VAVVSACSRSVQEPRAPAKPGQLLGDAFGVRCAPAHEPGSREYRGEAEQARGRVHERHSVAEPGAGRNRPHRAKERRSPKARLSSVETANGP